MSFPTHRPFHVLAKPIGPICNLRCRYCYYLAKKNLYPDETEWRMSDETLDAFVRQYIDSQPANIGEISFGWQGGEPTLLGIEFFKKVVQLQQQHVPPGVKIINAIQTNGTLLDKTWCDFFRRHHFLVGLSIDGPSEFHDLVRLDQKGQPTLEAVVQASRLLKKYRVEFNTLTCVGSHNQQNPLAVYRFLRDIGIEFIQFIPIVEPLSNLKNALSVQQSPGEQILRRNLVTDRSVDSERYGDFLIEVFDEWVHRDVGRIFVQIFDMCLAAWLGHTPSLCIFQRRCGSAMVLEHNGDLYCCDHFVQPTYLLGNIHDTHIAELANSQRQHDFGTDKETSLPGPCRECPVRFVCNGECPKNRFVPSPDAKPDTKTTDQRPINYLCAGYRKFFTHIDSNMRLMAAEIRQGRPAANVMQRLSSRGNRRPAASHVPDRSPQTATRNDPCPCGSGKKFKRCCMRRR